MVPFPANTKKAHTSSCYTLPCFCKCHSPHANQPPHSNKAYGYLKADASIYSSIPVTTIKLEEMNCLMQGISQESVFCMN